MVADAVFACRFVVDLQFQGAGTGGRWFSSVVVSPRLLRGCRKWRAATSNVGDFVFLLPLLRSERCWKYQFGVSVVVCDRISACNWFDPPLFRSEQSGPVVLFRTVGLWCLRFVHSLLSGFERVISFL